MARRKRRYKTGIWKSNKSQEEVHYRSGWELETLKFLDHQDDVISYQYEKIILPYVSNIKTGKIRRYFVDFLVEYKDGTKKLLEVKRKDKLTQVKTVKKLKTAEEYCKNNKMEFLIWTENEIKEITKQNKTWYPEPPKKKKVKRKRRKSK